jgi:hypothetical protein
MEMVNLSALLGLDPTYFNNSLSLQERKRYVQITIYFRILRGLNLIHGEAPITRMLFYIFFLFSVEREAILLMQSGISM